MRNSISSMGFCSMTSGTGDSGRHLINWSRPELLGKDGRVTVIVGRDSASWAVDVNRIQWHNNKQEQNIPCEIKLGDTVGLACDLVEMRMLVSVYREGCGPPQSFSFKLEAASVGDGLFAAFSSNLGTVEYNFGEAPFQFAPPDGFTGFEEHVSDNNESTQPQTISTPDEV